MKRNTIFLLGLLYLTNVVSATEIGNYNNGNGTIIDQRNNNDSIIITRKCETEVVIGDLADEDQRVIYDNYRDRNAIGELQDNDKIQTLEIYKVLYKNKPEDEWNRASGELWYKINFENLIGWICISPDYLGKYSDPYTNNRWQIIDSIQSSGKKWTIRALDQTLSVWENLNIRENPGITGNKVLYTIRPKDTDPPQSNVEVIAITEEVEIIDGIEDHWVKVKYKQYIGWIFGGYATAERGGPKYYIPEKRVRFDLGWY